MNLFKSKKAAIINPVVCLKQMQEVCYINTQQQIVNREEDSVDGWVNKLRPQNTVICFPVLYQQRLFFFNRVEQGRKF